MKVSTKNIKLKTNYDTSANLEVYMGNLTNWYRTTSREFRSFNGKRRINGVEYKGPVYGYNTNTIVDEPDSDKVINHNWQSKKREFENL